MKVFLSSTAQDLVTYRQVADDTILRMSQEAVVMERFGPLPGEPVAATIQTSTSLPAALAASTSRRVMLVAS
jgi:hypothetical protein